MSIEVTLAAAQRMRDFLGRNPSAAGIRFGVTRGGCSGFGYQVDLATEVTPEDRVLDIDGVKLVIAADALPLVEGTRIDYARTGLNSAFVFENPNAVASCGCGESFSVTPRG